MWNTTTLPFLPGYSFTDPTKSDFKVNQSLVYSQTVSIPKVVISDTAHSALESLEAENRFYDDLLVELTYGSRQSHLQRGKIPDVITFDKQVLRFYGYYREDINDCWNEDFRIHRVKVLYYLEDDTMEVVEPKVLNSGIPQGVILHRTKVFRPDDKGIYLWKDLNIGMDIIVFGKKIRIIDCDCWTKEYLESSGITLNPNTDTVPEDTYTKKKRELTVIPNKVGIKVEDDKLYKFLNYDGQVLRFYGLWKDTSIDSVERRKVILQFYLSDDTMDVIEKYGKNCGRDQIPCLVRRQKIPKKIKAISENFPTIYFEYSEREIHDWFGPKDLQVGKTVDIYNRMIFLYDCDEFTRKYYKNRFGLEIPSAIDIEEKPKIIAMPKPVPPYTGVGTWVDSLQSCMNLVPKPPKKDVLKIFYNDDKILRYIATMITPWPIDSAREFVISFYPSDDSIQITERLMPNSGFSRGKLLKRSTLPKNDVSTGERPDYYSAKDFYIGAIIIAYGKRFLIKDADKVVLKFMEANKHLYSEEILNIHRQKAIEEQMANKPPCLEKQELRNKMRQCVVTAVGTNAPLSLPFIDFDSGGYLKENVRQKLHNINLPISLELLDQAIDACEVGEKLIDITQLKKILNYALTGQGYN